MLFFFDLLFKSVWFNFHFSVSFTVFLILLISNLILWSEKVICMIAILLKLNLTYTRSHVYRMCILLLGIVFCVFGLLYCSSPLVPDSSSVLFAYHYWEWSIEFFTYYCRTVYFSLQLCQILLHTFWWSIIRYTL